jgi:hypothetical protein
MFADSKENSTPNARITCGMKIVKNLNLSGQERKNKKEV